MNIIFEVDRVKEVNEKIDGLRGELEEGKKRLGLYSSLSYLDMVIIILSGIYLLAGSEGPLEIFGKFLVAASVIKSF